MNRRLLTLLTLTVAVLVAGCGGTGSAPPGEAPAGQPRMLTVSAAASLTDVFGELKSRFEAANPGTTVRFNFGASSELASQIVNGAPADVFASANTAQMKKVTDAGLAAGRPELFVTNVLQIAVPPGNPKRVNGFADLNRTGLTTVVCAPQVPCGSATEQVERATGVMLMPVSEEPDVRSVLSKVTSGNADAGVVYVTDVRSARGKVDGVDFPEAGRAVNEYPIAALKNSGQPGSAAAFVEFVRGEDAKLVFKEAGFGTP